MDWLLCKQLQYVILSPHFVNDNTIYRLDFDAKEYEKLCQYPQGFTPRAHGMILDQDTKELHIFSNTRTI